MYGEMNKKTQKVQERFDVQAVNPRYKGAWMSDVARALLMPRNSEASATLKKSWTETRRCEQQREEI